MSNLRLMVMTALLCVPEIATQPPAREALAQDSPANRVPQAERFVDLLEAVDAVVAREA